MISLINYYLMKKRIAKIKLPNFKKEANIRVAITFIGKVKRVAFRNEVLLLAQRLGLVGFVENKKVGVVVEAEGYPSKINYLIAHLKTIPRFIIATIIIKKLNLKGEKTFHKK